MKIILLFDSINPSDKLDNCYRTYELNEKLSDALIAGKSISIMFCNPDKGDEVFVAKIIGEDL